MHLRQANYIYQIVHTLAFHPLFLRQHCAELERLYMELFFRPITIDFQTIKHQIIKLLEQNSAPSNVSVFIEIRLMLDGTIEIEEHSRSLNDGYVLRSVSPKGKAINFESPFGFAPTSARRSVLHFAKEMAQNLGGDVEIECDAQNFICAIDSAAPFGLYRRQLIAPRKVQSLEREMLISCIRRLNIELEERDLHLSELAQLDELFYIDHRGITALSSCGDHPFMNAFAHRIAKELATPWY